MRFNKILLLLFFLTIWTPLVISQEKPQRSIYLELLGPSTSFGISYDSRISPFSKLGYGVGLSYSYSKKSTFIFDNTASTVGIAVPIEVNYLIGNYKHNIEFGVGTSLGYYQSKFEYTDFTKEKGENGVIIKPKETISTSENIFGYFIYSNIGYRYTSSKGFQLRLGATPSFNFGDSHGIDRKPLLYPYLSLGYSF
ncbi:MAG TPA: hypothetical protein VLZ83_11595 [Edaphocola sp.]|jgi:hypothetical protein|nr:hypothetical protein [Edaphocola sp.]